jgi:hypothetical protein
MVAIIFFAEHTLPELPLAVQGMRSAEMWPGSATFHSLCKKDYCYLLQELLHRTARRHRRHTLGCGTAGHLVN